MYKFPPLPQTLWLGLLLSLILTVGARAAETAPAAKTIRLLAVGNSFSKDATFFLPELVKSQGQTLIMGNAEVGGCSLKRHCGFIEKYEANANDPAGKPYTRKDADGKSTKVSLKEYLEAEKWDIVTIQQFSLESFEPETFQPYANQLVAYIRKHAPQAKIWVHETWAYRVDHPLFKKGMTPEQMYEGLHNAYATVAKEVGAERILPVGTAFQNARKDPRWKLDLQTDFDRESLQPPALPRQVHSLVVGWNWDKKSGTPKLAYDGKHCNPAGRYLGAAVWYETMFGPLNDKAFVPKEVSAEDATFLREIAHKTVHKNLRP